RGLQRLHLFLLRGVLLQFSFLAFLFRHGVCSPFAACAEIAKDRENIAPCLSFNDCKSLFIIEHLF
ncbi:MAG: hypothetical protein IJS41_08955, partial [Clostridia bacterium]|nr:hypothetical protein [Clostridia bacterium]